jgi:hypothetical protein
MDVIRYSLTNSVGMLQFQANMSMHKLLKPGP